MSHRLCAVCQNRCRRNVFAKQAAGHAVHDDVGRMLLFVVSLNVDDGPRSWHVSRYPSVASDAVGVSKLLSTSMLPGIATI